MFKEAKDYMILAGIALLGLALYMINVITLNVVVLGIVSVLLIVVVLVQNPKGGGIDSTFGGSAGTQMFGASILALCSNDDYAKLWIFSSIRSARRIVHISNLKKLKSLSM